MWWTGWLLRGRAEAVDDRTGDLFGEIADRDLTAAAVVVVLVELPHRSVEFDQALHR